MGEECSTNRGDEKCFIIVVGKLEGEQITGKTKAQMGGYYSN